MKLKNFLIGFGFVAVLLTIIPLFTVNYWWIRLFDFPHVQLTILTLVATLTYCIKFDLKSKDDYAFILMLVACLVFQFSKIFIYTPLADKQVKKASADISDSKKLDIYVANVLQDNDKPQKLLAEINELNPQVVVLLETDTKWEGYVADLEKEYPYTVKKPLSNTYGLLIYSKKELINPKVEFVVADSIPSVDTKLKLNEKDIIQVYVIHPTPPMPKHNPKSTDRDGEMMITAKKARNSKIPTIVLGDFNDVAWSETTKEFQKLSRLLDPRIGRGFYSTYNADIFIFRWPLDHVFVSKEFVIDELDRGEHINSDHFPIYASIVLQEENDNQIPPELKEAELKKINKTIKEAKEARK
ncbi:endonuclease/exonuclease/phosphatase family protein [Mesonia sp. K7]|uniref:endonuclease/exonuclease/phosphatase family protein n=1 Tax=Mesonia sp. K7 TaxID=2218606 RepID=UPI000DA8C140|nr:endonuclease/exonuclease/phosphatase family protein [Mesonia sp. K7]PZD79322.1 endonuclease/exonuclease/phosphatase family protein [Mesonia sp. K7]